MSSGIVSKFLQERQREINLARFMKLLLRAAEKDGDRVSRYWFGLVIERLEQLIVARGCSLDDVLEHLNSCRPRDTRVMLDLPDDKTPTARPSAKRRVR